jgi:outer membrane biogenesis lipoprotein LolB
VRRAAPFLGWLLLAAACRGLPGQLPALAPDDRRPAELLAALDARASERQALRGRARIAVDADDGVRLRGSQVLVLERPDRLRVEILGFLGETEVVLTTSGESYELFLVGEQRYESGTLYPGLLWDVARIDLEPREVVDLLLGAPIPDGGVRLELAGGGEREAFVFDAEGRLRHLERTRRGRAPWEARFGEYETVAGTPLAHAIAFERAGARAEVSLRDVELNPALPERLFRLRP